MKVYVPTELYHFCSCELFTSFLRQLFNRLLDLVRFRIWNVLKIVVWRGSDRTLLGRRRETASEYPKSIFVNVHHSLDFRRFAYRVNCKPDLRHTN